MNLCSPARVMLIILTKGVYTNQLSRWHSARLCVGERCVCLLRLCRSKRWCAQTFTYDLTGDRRGTRSASRSILVLSLSLTQTHVFHDDRRRAMHSLLHHFPFQVSFHTQTLWDAHSHTKRTLYTEARVGLTAFLSVFSTVVSAHNSAPVKTAGRWYRCECECVRHQKKLL